MTAKKKTPLSDPKTVSGFLLREKAAWEALSGTWKGLPEKALLRPGACGKWSIKDVMNHIASWQAATRLVFSDLLAGRSLPKGKYTIGKFNPIEYARYRKFPLSASKRRLQRNRKMLLDLLAGVPKNRLLDLKHPVGVWAKYTTYGHYQEHLKALTVFRRKASTGSASPPKNRKTISRQTVWKNR
jgi:hypothetical protein